MTARVLLLGAGADIGSNLLGRNAPELDGFAITDVVTRPVEPDPAIAPLTSMEQIRARIVLADPRLLDTVTVDEQAGALRVNGNAVRFHFFDVHDERLETLGRFDAAIVATSRSHVRSDSFMARVGSVAGYVVGVAENTRLPGMYGPLVDLSPQQLGFDADLSVSGQVLALGSCQCVGWAAQLRGLVEAAGGQPLDLVRAEVEIVHPDTASSTFGTVGVGARREDARDNLRPGFSQLQSSMGRLPGVSVLNTVSLRVLTQPPGYQVCRFFVRADLSADAVLEGFREARSRCPGMIGTTDVPIGSRAFSAAPAVATIITAPSHLHVDNQTFAGAGLTEVITQAYVHNTLGYSNNALQCVSRLLAGPSPTLLPPTAECHVPFQYRRQHDRFSASAEDSLDPVLDNRLA